MKVIKIIATDDNFLIITNKKTLFRKRTVMYIYNFNEILFPYLHIKSVEKMFDEAKSGGKKVFNHFFTKVLDEDVVNYLQYIL